MTIDSLKFFGMTYSRTAGSYPSSTANSSASRWRSSSAYTKRLRGSSATWVCESNPLWFAPERLLGAACVSLAIREATSAPVSQGVSMASLVGHHGAASTSVLRPVTAFLGEHHDRVLRICGRGDRRLPWVDTQAAPASERGRAEGYRQYRGRDERAAGNKH